ncbi:MAG: glycosyltransferase [Fibromonadaceae bacterium]|nr:glycosyltransferase [Fibromonadaceae bacterium]
MKDAFLEIYVKLCFLLNYWPHYGGAELVTRILVKEFSNKGNDIYIAYFQDFGVDCNLNYPQIKLPDKINFDSIENINILNNFLNTNKIDIIICQFWYLAPLANASRKGISAKLIYCHHFPLIMPLTNKKKFKIFYNLLNFIRDKRSVYRQVLRIYKIYTYVDALILLSYEYIKQYENFFWNRNFKKLHAISNPSPYVSTEQINFNKKENFLLFVGRIDEPVKRISLVIELWRIICNKYLDWTLLIVGDGPDLEKTKKNAESLPRVQFEGFKNPDEYYTKSSILLVTSEFEGFGMVLIEAQNFGCVPVVMSNSHASLPDIIQDGENGLIVPNNEMEVFVEKVELLMNNQDLREKMAKNGIESVKKFSIENIVEKWEKLFGKLLK